MANEPGQAVLAIFDGIIDRIKSTRPLRSDNKPLETGFVYSQLVLGMMVDPDDFKNPWTPIGGATVHDAVASGAVPATAGAAPVPGASSAQVGRAIQAAFNTSQLVDRLIMVTKDESRREYPGGGRTVSFAYDGIVNGMQPLPAPPIAPDIQKRIDEAQKTLHELDEEGNIVGKTKLYQNYVKNAKAYAVAKKDFADAQTAAKKDPAKLESFPMDSIVLNQAVDEAFDTLKTEGAERVERALGVIESVGVSIQDHMIAKARKTFDAWNLGLAGVPVTTPYSSVTPSSWADPDRDVSGWTKLHVESSDYRSHAAQNSHFFQQSSSHSESSSTSESAGGSYFGFGADVSASQSSSESHAQGSAAGGSSNVFSNDATGLTIDLEYGLCDVNRPWFMGDLFYMKNWFLVNNVKNAISDGTINGQADSDKSLLPMIPMQFLVIRNVKIKAEHWNQDGRVMDQFFGAGRSDASASQSSVSASGGWGFGPIALKAGVDHSEAQANNSQSSESHHSGSQDFEAHFKNETLEIKGAQVIAWLSTILPACAPLDDDGLKKPEKEK